MSRGTGGGGMKKPRPALFENYVVENGKRRRATRAELAEAHRLWWKHKDVRTGRVGQAAA